MQSLNPILGKISQAGNEEHFIKNQGSEDAVFFHTVNVVKDKEFVGMCSDKGA
jgi:hypothetical protein